jgi:phosphoribosyl 1,2-cyclic phosphate phosphodiesterase
MLGELTFLGTGTSMGVPTLGCRCAVCTSTDPHDRRLRPSVLLRWMDACPFAGLPGKEQVGPRERVVVIDTGPDFREQALRAGVTRVDAVFYTHGHADHLLGMDDLRPISFVVNRESGPIPLYASAEATEVLTRVYDYTFSPSATYPNRARVELHPLAERTAVHGVEFLRVPVLHGQMEIAGFRCGKVAYLTDVSAIPESSFALLQGLDHVILSALRHKPHPNHSTLSQALEYARRIGARHTWFTHIAHELGHEETNRALPENVRLAHDGLRLTVDLGAKTIADPSPAQDGGNAASSTS